MFREPTVLLGREPGRGSPCCGIDVLHGGDIMLVLVGHCGLTLYVRVKGGHAQQEGEKLTRSSTHSLILGMQASLGIQVFLSPEDWASAAGEMTNPVVSRLEGCKGDQVQPQPKALPDLPAPLTDLDPRCFILLAVACNID